MDHPLTTRDQLAHLCFRVLGKEDWMFARDTRRYVEGKVRTRDRDVLTMLEPATL
ncbi:MAG: hypothetical protein ACP5JV_08765 [Thermus sp.]|uniref:hypothetical protein n=1 Tax=Thermus sp. TaxID=275 RepID=UPI003D13583E